MSTTLYFLAPDPGLNLLLDWSFTCVRACFIDVWLSADVHNAERKSAYEGKLAEGAKIIDSAIHVIHNSKIENVNRHCSQKLAA
jgi:hypothetical protein